MEEFKLKVNFKSSRLILFL